MYIIGKWWYKDTSAVHEIPSVYIRHFQYTAIPTTTTTTATSKASSLSVDTTTAATTTTTMLLSIWMDIVNPKESDTCVTVTNELNSNDQKMESAVADLKNNSYQYNKGDMYKWIVKSFPILNTPVIASNISSSGVFCSVPTYTLPESEKSVLDVQYYQTRSTLEIGGGSDVLEFTLGAYVDELLLDDAEPIRESPFPEIDLTIPIESMKLIHSRHNTSRIQINCLYDVVSDINTKKSEIAIVDLKCNLCVNSSNKEYLLKLLIPI